MVTLRRIPFVDSLRGIAALLVLFHHAFLHFPSAFAALPPGMLAACAWLSGLNVQAVLLFFVVSGFSIRLSVESLDLRSAPGLNEYAYRRLKRILPLYLFSLAFAAICVRAAGVPVAPDALSFSTLLGNVLFLQTSAGVPGCWFPPFAENGPLWSLSFEMFYYLLFPLHLWIGQNPRHRLAASLALSALAMVLNRLWPNPFAAFALNYGIWYAGVEVAEHWLGRTGAPRWLPVAAFLALLAATFAVDSSSVSALCFGMALLVLGQLVVDARFLHALAGTVAVRAAIEALAWVGGISYGLYLLHFPLLRATAATLGTGAGALAMAVTASLALALFAERVSLRPRYLFLKRRYLG